MLSSITIAFIGGGVMCEAIINSLIKGAGVTADRITVAEPIAERRAQLAERYGVKVTASSPDAAKNSHICVLAVKPQVMAAALSDLRASLNPLTLIISIAAGVTIRTITQVLGDAQPVVRVMPNTPAQIGEGMSVWTSTGTVTAGQMLQAKDVLASMGNEVYVDNEHYIDMATAISGSGPAYVFLFMEALIDVGVHLGFSRAVAQQLVEQTIKGSIDFALQTGKYPTELRNQVTSPGGTTAAALYELERGGLRTTLADGVWAAYERAVELGTAKSSD
jgi:pyrroline-5-carboxylate reductase